MEDMSDMLRFRCSACRSQVVCRRDRALIARCPQCRRLLLMLRGSNGVIIGSSPVTLATMFALLVLGVAMPGVAAVVGDSLRPWIWRSLLLAMSLATLLFAVEGVTAVTTRTSRSRFGPLTGRRAVIMGAFEIGLGVCLALLCLYGAWRI